MRQLACEVRTVWFAQYESKVQLTDEQGRYTGEIGVSYGKPFMLNATLSPNSGNTWGDGFGVGVDMDRSLVINDVGLGVTESCIAWVDVTPAIEADGTISLVDDGLMLVPNDYAVSMVAESYNFTNIALKKVE